MRKTLVWVLVGTVLIILVVLGIWKLAKSKAASPAFGTLVSSQGKVRLSPEETRNFMKNVPVLPGKQGINPTTGPASVRREMQTINEIQRINDMNKRNSRKNQ